MPKFPGLPERKDMKNWDPGFPVQLNKIRDKDEDYWDRYRGTPKAFIALAQGQRMWSNRFGNLTAIRFSNQNTSVEQIKTIIHHIKSTWV